MTYWIGLIALAASGFVTILLILFLTINRERIYDKFWATPLGKPTYWEHRLQVEIEYQRMRQEELDQEMRAMAHRKIDKDTLAREKEYEEILAMQTIMEELEREDERLQESDRNTG